MRGSDESAVIAIVIPCYQQAVEDGADIVVNVDGDGQMDSTLIPLFVAEIAECRADYVKGNRFSAMSLPTEPPIFPISQCS